MTIFIKLIPAGAEYPHTAMNPLLRSLRALLPLLFVLAVAFTPARAEVKLEPPVPVRTVPPDYPSEMRRQHVSGVVMVSCVIDAKGNVENPKVLHASADDFASPALAAIKQWKFKPAQRDGASVALHVTIPIRFNIES